MNTIGPIYRGYGEWADAMEAYRHAILNNKLKVLPVVLMLDRETRL